MRTRGGRRVGGTAALAGAGAARGISLAGWGCPMQGRGPQPGHRGICSRLRLRKHPTNASLSCGMVSRVLHGTGPARHHPVVVCRLTPAPPPPLCNPWGLLLRAEEHHTAAAAVVSLPMLGGCSRRSRDPCHVLGRGCCTDLVWAVWSCIPCVARLLLVLDCSRRVHACRACGTRCIGPGVSQGREDRSCRWQLWVK